MLFNLRKSCLPVALAMLMTLGMLGMAMAAPKEVRIGYLAADQLHGPAVMVMKQRNMLEKAGIPVKWNEFLAGSYVMQEMASGSLDFACCGAVPIMISHAQGVKMNIIASGNQEGSALVVGPDVKTVKDLDGKNVGTPGTGSMQDAMVAKYAKDNNVRIRRMAMKVSDMPLFLQKGEVDGFMAWEPHTARAVAQKFGRIMVTSHDLMPSHQCCVFVVPAALAKDDPELVRKVTAVYLEAYRWFLDHPDESVTMLSKVTGMGEDIIRTAMKTCKYPEIPYCNEASMAELTTGLIQTKKIVAIKEDQVASFMKDLYNPTFVEQLTGTKRP